MALLSMHDRRRPVAPTDGHLNYLDVRREGDVSAEHTESFFARLSTGLDPNFHSIFHFTSIFLFNVAPIYLFIGFVLFCSLLD